MNKLKTGILSSSYTGTGSGGGDKHSMGYFETSAELAAAHPVGEAGDWAIVGTTDTVWVWDLTASGWKDTGQGAVVAWGGITGVITNQVDLSNALNAKENTVNRVTSFQAIPDNSHYPSEKLVKDALDAKEPSANKTSSFQTVPDNTKFPTEKLVKDNLDLKLNRTDEERMTPKVLMRSADVMDIMAETGDTDIAAPYRFCVSGDYLYTCPDMTPGWDDLGKVVRVSLKDFRTVKVLDLQTISGDAELSYFADCITDGKYLYLLPYYPKIVRILLEDFETYDVLDLSAAVPDFGGFNVVSLHNATLTGYDAVNKRLYFIDLYAFTYTGSMAVPLPAGATRWRNFTYDDRYVYALLGTTAPTDIGVGRYNINDFSDADYFYNYAGYTFTGVLPMICDGRNLYIDGVVKSDGFQYLIRINVDTGAITGDKLTETDSSIEQGSSSLQMYGRYLYFTPAYDYTVPASPCNGVLKRLDLTDLTGNSVETVDLSTVHAEIGCSDCSAIDRNFLYFSCNWTDLDSWIVGTKLVRVPLDVNSAFSREEYLRLDQTTPQSIVNGVPLLEADNGDISDPYHLVNKDFIDKRTRGGGGFLANVFFRTDDSDKPAIGTKYKRIDYLAEAAETELSAAVKASEGDKLIRTYLYDGALETTLLDAGIYTANYRAKVSGAAGITQIGFQVFVMDIAGVETTLFTSWSTELNNTDFLTLRNESNQPSYTVNATDRFGVRIYARTTHASDITITTVVGGEHGSYFSTPLPLRHNLLRARDAADAHPMSAITGLTARFSEADETHYNGLLEASNFAVTYDEGTKIFTLTLAAAQQISLSRVLYTIPAGVYTTVAHANASDVYYLLFNGTTFIASTSFDFGSQAILAYVSYNATTGKGILFDERHPADIDKGMPPMVHAWLHFYQGALLESGGAVSGHTLNSNTKTDMQPVIEETKIADESLKKTLGALAAGTYKTAYRSGTVASGEWTYVNSDTPIRYDGSNNPIHNDISGVNALSTAVSANNRWLNVYVIATNAYDAAYQYLWIQPQTLHTSETAAFDEDFLTAVNWGDKPVAEIVPLAKFTFRRQAGAMNFRITRMENIRGTKVSLATTTSVSIHNNLGGRTALDAHPVSSISNAQNEIFPIEIFEDGATPPSELDITDGKRYRDFTVNDDADLYTLKRISYNSPSSARLVMVISNATAPAAGETINFEISVNGGAAVTLSYVGLGTEAQNDVIVTDFESASFGTGNYTVNIKRVAGTYAQEIGVMAVEVN